MFSHRFHRFTQNFLAEKNSVKYVDSVGDIHALTSKGDKTKRIKVE
jgi:hypothetical protein